MGLFQVKYFSIDGSTHEGMVNASIQHETRDNTRWNLSRLYNLWKNITFFHTKFLEIFNQICIFDFSRWL